MRILLVLLALVTPAMGQQAQTDYADHVRRTLLQAGVPYEVLVKSDTMIIWGGMNQAVVYRLAFGSSLLASAKSAGFKSVQFTGRPSMEKWHFDLKGAALPACDISRRLCS